ncbi:Adaptive-response sensory-kinase SasA [Sporomusa rhizae]|uniref:sensor histidine kinase n=1 Tax=Sporomusa rhizae TaxID=357999 RepID=UPI003529F9D4
MKRFRGRRNHHEHFLRHYKMFRLLRPAGVLFNLVVFYLLFIWAVDKQLVILFGTLLILKEIAHFLFLLRFDRRTIQPMIKLKQGLDEVTQGNYLVKVENSLPNDMAIVLDSFNQMTAKLHEGERLQAEYEENRKALLANISHDLKTPITAIQGYVEALLDSSPGTGENREKYIRTIYHNTVYVNKLIDDLFLFAKLDMQKLEFQFKRTDIGAFMDDLMEEYGFDYHERNIVFEYQNSLKEPVWVDLDGKRLRQAINNILNNALNHGPSQGLVLEASLSRQGELICLDIRDNGPGIPAEKLPFIFDRFYRIDQERPKEIAGTGLGLAIAKELVEAHRGEITAQSVEHEGCCFSVKLPVSEDGKRRWTDETNPDN